MRFEKREDCYYDTETGLEWSLENYSPHSWEEAMNICKNLGNGWSLPTIEELLSIIDYGKFSPATDLPDMLTSGYWSGSAIAYGTDYAWHVNFYFGYVDYHNKPNHYYVRCVRERNRSRSSARPAGELLKGELR